MDCVSLCPTTCSNMGVTSSPCPRVCVEGCGCPEDMVINEEQGRCMMPSQCPDQGTNNDTHHECNMIQSNFWIFT